jgi:hypothetical protein
MDLNKALDILEIDKATCKITNLSSNIKKQYHKLALQYHPDKNGNSLESCEKFKEIGEAYEYAKREIEENEEKGEKDCTDYGNLLKKFIEEILASEKTEHVMNLIAEIVTGCKKITWKLFESLDKESTLHVYSFLSKYKNVLYIHQDILDAIKEITMKKYIHDEIYILNPSLEDLLENRVYKLQLREKVYYVPLWHDEVYFDDEETKEIIVKCVPELPNHIYINDNNDIIVDLEIPLDISLLEQKSKVVFLGKKTFEIFFHQLSLQRSQLYVFHECGISKVFEKDIYKIEERGSVIFKIIFT